jgi:uncharacterized RDD family membrane protein YckC
MIYDALLLTAVLFIAGFAFIYFTDYPRHQNLRPLLQLFLLGMIAAYFCWFWCKSGQTLAMKTWRIRLINRDATGLSAIQALLRFALALVGICCAGVSIWWSLIDREKQFLHDRLTGNRLIVVAQQQ